jgi:hypothetical protein
VAIGALASAASLAFTIYSYRKRKAAGGGNGENGSSNADEQQSNADNYVALQDASTTEAIQLQQYEVRTRNTENYHVGQVLDNGRKVATITADSGREGPGALLTVG